MSTFRHPAGPQPSRVYWRRRLVVLIALIAVIIVLVLIVSRLAAGSPTEDASADTTETSDAAEPPADDAETDPVASEEPIAGAACAPQFVSITAVADATSYAADRQPQLAFSITNTGSVACTYNVGTTQQTFVVTSGDDQYWSSKDCETDPVDAPLLLDPNVAVTSTPIPWDRTRSTPETCDEDRPAAPGGGATYNFAVTVGDIESEPVSFLLN